MAEGGESWWGSWLQTAKEKSSNVFEFMKRDVDEFTHTFHRETKTVVSNAANALKTALQIDESDSTTNQVKKSVSSFLGSVTQAFTPTLEENEDELCVIRNNEPIIMDRLQSQIYNLRTDPKTYLEDPESLADYEEWIKDFDLENKQPDLSNILISSMEVQNMYSKLVPLSVSHIIFWHRYFYKLFKLYEAEDRKKALMLRANAQGEEIEWDDEDAGNNIEISEHLADKLLFEYELECKERKKIEDENRNYSKNFIKMPEGNSMSLSNLKISYDEHIDKSIENVDSIINVASDNNKALRSESIEELRSIQSNENVTCTTSANVNKESNVNVQRNVSEAFNTETMKLSEKNVLVDSQTKNPAEGKLTASTKNDSLENLVTKDKGDLVVVARKTNDGISPASSQKEGSNDEEWEKDFDLEVSEEDIKNAQKITTESTEHLSQEGDEEWENW